MSSDLFGSIFDFDGDGKTSLEEEVLGFLTFEEAFSDPKPLFETRDVFDEDNFYEDDIDEDDLDEDGFDKDDLVEDGFDKDDFDKDDFDEDEEF